MYIQKVKRKESDTERERGRNAGVQREDEEKGRQRNEKNIFLSRVNVEQ